MSRAAYLPTLEMDILKEQFKKKKTQTWVGNPLKHIWKPDKSSYFIPEVQDCGFQSSTTTTHQEKCLTLPQRAYFDIPRSQFGPPVQFLQLILTQLGILQAIVCSLPKKSTPVLR